MKTCAQSIRSRRMTTDEVATVMTQQLIDVLPMKYTAAFVGFGVGAIEKRLAVAGYFNMLVNAEEKQQLIAQRRSQLHLRPMVAGRPLLVA